ncbi:hypothetical protein [Pseudoalteromonas sp. M8]|uniref:hypothetical protein n=1 Tax=Pseudoalteromonas sp. M8 TaxID=2692624 RepID=UPI001BA52F58|nr:hypothetical protein [Pseudoalteromonas sp. M8]QUI69603.1 hypothetical protein GSF13_07290 [Pseudoalteromonas sp. M8]
MSYLVQFVSEFHSIIGHTYTIIAGFVAIGIPLSIQFSAQYSDKHDNALLSTRLTRGKYVNPKSILSLSFLYMALSLYYLTFASSKHSSLSISSTHLDILKFSLPALFAVLICFTFYFYWRLFKKITVKSSLQIQNYLQLDVKQKSKTNLFVKLLKSQLAHLNRRFPWLTKYLESLITEAPIQKQASADIDSINAGLELLIYNIEKRSWNLEFEALLNQFDATIYSCYFGYGYELKHKIELSETDLFVIKTYWHTLSRLIKHARKNEDIPMSFHTQRLISAVLRRIIYHPRRDLITPDGHFSENSSKINWAQDIYELARWQNYQTSEGIDLILECEWFSNMFYSPDNIDLKRCVEGIYKLHKLAIDIFDIIASSKPNTAIKFVKNISRAVSHGQEQQYYAYYPTDEGNKWLLNYWQDFNNITFCAESINELVEKIDSLSNGEAFKQYKNSLTSKPLNRQSLESALSVIRLDEILEHIHLKLVKRMGWNISARLAYYERWNEFYDCLYWKQPKEANALHLGETLLVHSATELADLIFHEYQHIESHWPFYGRHAIKVYAFRAFLFQLYFFAEQDETPSLMYNSGSFDDIPTQISIIESLLEQEEYISNVRQWDKATTKVCENLRNTVETLNERKLRLIKQQNIDKPKWLTLVESIEKGWESKLLLTNTMEALFSHKVAKNRAELLKSKVDRADLIGKKGFAPYSPALHDHVHRLFIDKIYRACIENGMQGQASLPIEGQALYFAPLQSLQRLGFKRSGSIYWESTVYKNVLAIVKDSHVIVDCNKIRLIITKNLCSNNNSPLFISLEDKNEPQVQVNVEVYFELELQGKGAITLC